MNDITENPIRLFCDIDGQPIDDGYLWFGEPYKDPKTHPIAVYWDQELTIPASQPIRTRGGFPLNGSSISNVFCFGDYSVTVENKNGGFVASSMSNRSGVWLESGTDCTIAIQNALDQLELRGGGVLRLPPGTFYVSIAESASADACLLVPSNVIFEGSGMNATTIQRLPSERGVDGVLIVNKYWDTNGGYTAAGNIVFQDFSITDGAAAPQRTSGDLIGIGHGENVIVQRVKAGNHDQHFVDICGSKNVKVIDCVGFCEHAGGYNASATVQIDGVAAGAIQGIFVDSTVSIDCEVASNHFVNKTTSILMHVGHKDMIFKNILIHHNVFDGSYSAGQSVIGCDSNVGFENLNISDNIVICNHERSRCVNLFTNGGTNFVFKNASVCNNQLKGKSRLGIYVGVNQDFSELTYPDFENLVIAGNNIDIDASQSFGLDILGIHVEGFKSAVVNQNNVILTHDDDTTATGRPTRNIRIGRNQNISVVGNILKKIISSPTHETFSNGIRLEGRNPLTTGASNVTIANNLLYAPGQTYLIAFASVNEFTKGVDNCLISGNTKIGDMDAAALALIFELFPSSDGTNFRTQVDFTGAGGYTQAIASGELYSGLLLPGKKLGASSNNETSPAIIELQFTSAGATGFDDDAEQIGFAYLSATTCAGTVVKNVNQPSGTFSIVTGVSGVSATIDNATFEPIIKTTGHLRAFASI